MTIFWNDSKDRSKLAKKSRKRTKFSRMAEEARQFINEESKQILATHTIPTPAIDPDEQAEDFEIHGERETSSLVIPCTADYSDRFEGTKSATYHQRQEKPHLVSPPLPNSCRGNRTFDIETTGVCEREDQINPLSTVPQCITKVLATSWSATHHQQSATVHQRRSMMDNSPVTSKLIWGTSGSQSSYPNEPCLCKISSLASS